MWRPRGTTWRNVCWLSLLSAGCSPIALRGNAGGPAVESTSSATGLAAWLPWSERTTASNQRLWRPDLAVLATADFERDRVRIRNVRNARYRSDSDYDVRHYDLEFALADVESVDFVVVPFRNAPLIAHTMLSFGLRDGQHFLLSVEGRMEQGENYTTTNGTTRGFELVYLIGDERDLIPLRTDIRRVDVYLYRGRATPAQAQLLLVDVLGRANQLARQPEFYHTLRNNCTTNLVDHVNRLRPGAVPFDWRLVLPGKSDELAHQLGLLAATGDFATLKQNSRINDLVNRHRHDPDFSRAIRQFPAYRATVASP